MTMTEYAKTSDNFLAHRYFRVQIYAGLLSNPDVILNINEIFIDVFANFAVSDKFVYKIINDYVKAGLLEYEDKDKVTITAKGLEDIKRIKNG